MALLRADGVMVQLGIPGGNPAISVPLQDIVFSQKKVAGSIVGGRADMNEMLAFAAQHGIRPLTEERPMREVNAALAHVAAGKARYRVVLLADE
jgi:uncharacterized zinc-type alcohol dehydrogenase-like protein